jgi:hypothetical protein
VVFLVVVSVFNISLGRSTSLSRLFQLFVPQQSVLRAVAWYALLP